MTALHTIRSHYLDCASRAIQDAQMHINRAWAQHRHPACPALSEYARTAIEEEAERLERMAADLRQMIRVKLEVAA